MYICGIKYKRVEKAKNRIGEKHITNEGYAIEIIECFSVQNCTIQFEDGLIFTNRGYQSIVKGNIKNPLHKSVHRAGFSGIGKYTRTTYPKIYHTWHNMLSRCYDEKYQEIFPTYIGCIVCEEWNNFQNFAQWFEKNYNSEIMEGWHLDKDILVKENKIYSPEMCCFVPQEINLLFTKCNKVRGECPIGITKVRSRFRAYLSIDGKRVHIGYFDTPEEAFQAHKTAKENHIKNVADKWRGQITEPTYEALINYKVEITD